MPAAHSLNHCCYDVCLHTSPRLQLAELLPGREALDCENLFAQYQTFLSLPYSSGLQAAFVAMVKDVYKNKLEEEATKPAVRGYGCVCVRAAALGGARAVKGQRQLRARVAWLLWQGRSWQHKGMAVGWIRRWHAHALSACLVASDCVSCE